ncbi:MAG TPA: sulfurtransferase TusA family protein [Gammaproteobacteria bacterium]|nr:sulfurtransferase TusA family protein [Gammaproteobacteria bacterium]
MSHRAIDARGLFCPMPVIRVQDALKEMAPGDTAELVATDPGALNDVTAWCRVHGHRVVATEQDDGEVRIRIEVGGHAGT